MRPVGYPTAFHPEGTGHIRQDVGGLKEHPSPTLVVHPAHDGLGPIIDQELRIDQQLVRSHDQVILIVLALGQEAMAFQPVPLGIGHLLDAGRDEDDPMPDLTDALQSFQRSLDGWYLVVEIPMMEVVVDLLPTLGLDELRDIPVRDLLGSQRVVVVPVVVAEPAMEQIRDYSIDITRDDHRTSPTTRGMETVR